MTFEGIDKILNSLTRQEGWDDYQHYRQIILCWQKSVSPRLLHKTRVVSLSRGVVSIATAGAALAQDLTLQRSSLIKRLNACLEKPVTDIRFSSAQWQEKAAENSSRPPIPDSTGPTVDPQLPTPVSGSGFDRWRQRIHQRSLTWSSCPECQAPTPERELQRWNRCSLCWSRSTR
ncbi:MAG: hypothetical protein N5P05_004003 [Chroococcopsis gigantea SAG 12.99]|jgi:predicted nucleic acid-binding Zn ribbon protein|nr:hypothetical protein [Chroococcopsis gigantea SAG 12.99]